MSTPLPAEAAASAATAMACGQSCPGRADHAARGARRVFWSPGRDRRAWRPRLRPRVAGRDREPQHVGERARISVRDRPGERGDLRREHRFRRDNPLEERQSPWVLALRCALQQVAVGQLAREPDTHAAARPRSRGEALRNQVVKWPVKVSQRDVDGNPSDRQLSGRALRHGPVLPDAPDPAVTRRTSRDGLSPIPRATGLTPRPSGWHHAQAFPQGVTTAAAPLAQPGRSLGVTPPGQRRPPAP